jgi:23S rRNA (pseudouridine1915-N3)-methyltransferase
LIGGAFGVSDEVRQKSHRVISLSELTMNHLVAESVLLEQIYRSYTILNRIPYHNA